MSRESDLDKPWCFPDGPPRLPDPDQGCYPESPARSRRRRPFDRLILPR